MPRLLFEKKGNAVWISHLDLMRLFQRAFKRAGLPLTHTHGFNPRPSVSIALPMSVGVTSCCELLDFDLDGETVPCEEILHRLNEVLVSGVRVLRVYEDGRKIKYLSFLECRVVLEYDRGIPDGAVQGLTELFQRDELTVDKRTKSNGIQQQNIIPMIRKMEIESDQKNCLTVHARIACQNPTLNPMQIVAAIEKYTPQWKPNFAKSERCEIFDAEENIFR